MSKIEWTDQTWNPTTGCQKISAGCENCYAEKWHKRLQSIGLEKYKRNFNFVRTHESELDKRFVKKPSKIFINSMGDLFHHSVSYHFVFKVLEVIRKNPQHIFQILTKRPGRMGYFFANKSFLENLWLGVTVENKKELHRIDILRQFHAAVKFISFEPLLEHVSDIDLSGIDWVIAGAETGNGARPMDIEWARSLFMSCWNQGNIPFFFKKVSKGDICPDDLKIREFPEAK